MGVWTVIGRLHHIVLDCPDPHRLAEFYSAMLGQPVTYTSDDFCVVAQHERASGLGFQRSTDHQPPTWPSPEVGQQIHFDVMVDDLETADAAITALGAQPLKGPGVYADPAGHPFCLVKRPAWAPAITSA